MVFATLGGLVLSIIFMSTRNLIAPIIAHAAFDAFYFAGGVAFLWRIYNRAWQALMGYGVYRAECYGRNRFCRY